MDTPNTNQKRKGLIACIEAEERTNEKWRSEIEKMFRKTTDVFEPMEEIRIEQIKQGEWATADNKAGYNQALKDLKSLMKEKK